MITSPAQKPSPNLGTSPTAWVQVLAASIVDALSDIDTEHFSRFLTVNLGLAAAWRHDVFNWFDLLATVGCIYSMATLIFYEFSHSGMSVKSQLQHNDILVQVATVACLSVRFLGFLKGTDVQMAT